MLQTPVKNFSRPCLINSRPPNDALASGLSNARLGSRIWARSSELYGFDQKDLFFLSKKQKISYCAGARPSVPFSDQLVSHFKCWAAEVNYSCQWRLSDVSTCALDSILWCWFVADVIDVTGVSKAINPFKLHARQANYKTYNDINKLIIIK